MDKYRVALTEEERAELERMVSCGKATARKLTYARILLLADDSCREEHSDEEIITALGTSLRTVSHVRQPLVTQGMELALLRRWQPPRPEKVKIKGDVEQRLLELACSDPLQGRCHWTLPLLADERVVLGLVNRVGIETVRQTLKKRHQAMDCRNLVYPAGCGRRVCLAYGRRHSDLPVALRPRVSRGLLR